MPASSATPLRPRGQARRGGAGHRRRGLPETNAQWQATQAGRIRFLRWLRLTACRGLNWEGALGALLRAAGVVTSGQAKGPTPVGMGLDLFVGLVKLDAGIGFEPMTFRL